MQLSLAVELAAAASTSSVMAFGSADICFAHTTQGQAFTLKSGNGLLTKSAS